MPEDKGVTHSDFVRFSERFSQSQNPAVTHREFDQLVRAVGEIGDEQTEMRKVLVGLVRVEERQQSMLKQLIDLQEQHHADRQRIESVNASSEARDDVLTEAIGAVNGRMDVWKHRLWLPGVVLGSTGVGAGLLGPRLAAVLEAIVKTSSP